MVVLQSFLVSSRAGAAWDIRVTNGRGQTLWHTEIPDVRIEKIAQQHFTGLPDDEAWQHALVMALQLDLANSYADNPHLDVRAIKEWLGKTRWRCKSCRLTLSIIDGDGHAIPFLFLMLYCLGRSARDIAQLTEVPPWKSVTGTFSKSAVQRSLHSLVQPWEQALHVKNSHRQVDAALRFAHSAFSDQATIVARETRQGLARLAQSGIESHGGTTYLPLPTHIYVTLRDDDLGRETVDWLARMAPRNHLGYSIDIIRRPWERVAAYSRPDDAGHALYQIEHGVLTDSQPAMISWADVEGGTMASFDSVVRGSWKNLVSYAPSSNSGELGEFEEPSSGRTAFRHVRTPSGRAVTDFLCQVTVDVDDFASDTTWGISFGQHGNDHYHEEFRAMVQPLEHVFALFMWDDPAKKWHTLIDWHRYPALGLGSDELLLIHRSGGLIMGLNGVATNCPSVVPPPRGKLAVVLQGTGSLGIHSFQLSVPTRRKAVRGTIPAV